MHEVILIRHAEVMHDWKSRCYGAMDVPLSQAGILASQQRADELALGPAPVRILHSGLQRTQRLAAMIGEHFPATPIIEVPALRERDYGGWQGKNWDEVYASDPDFHNVIHQPDTYRPPGGETTREMQVRVVSWFESLLSPESSDWLVSGPIIAISHSGPMAALAGHCLELHATEWGPWMVRYLDALHFRPGSGAVAVTLHSPASPYSSEGPTVADRMRLNKNP
jgi:broad specificity phosphatase PhoE